MNSHPMNSLGETGGHPASSPLYNNAIITM